MLQVFSAKINAGQSSLPSSRFPLQRPGNPSKLVRGNFFSVTPAISTSDKPHNKFCLLNRRSARSQSPQLSQPPQLPLSPKGLKLSSSSQLFPLSSSLPISPAGTSAASDNQSTPPCREAVGLHSPRPTPTSYRKARGPCRGWVTAQAWAWPRHHLCACATRVAIPAL